MFDQKILSSVVELQEKSYKLLKWVNEGLKQGKVNFSKIHTTMSAAEAAQEWITRNYENLPTDIRPEKDQINKFAHLFSSYLTTSFELVENAITTKRATSLTCCWCPICSYLIVERSHLKTRKPSNKATYYARELKLIYLRALAESIGLPLLDSELETLLTDHSLKESISLATYGNELIRRSQFASQGDGNLILWREFAWEGQKPKKKFNFSVEMILEAEKKLIQHMKNTYIV